MCIGIFSFRAFDRRLARLAAPISSGVRQGGAKSAPPAGRVRLNTPAGRGLNKLSSSNRFGKFWNFDPWWPQFWPEPNNDRNDFSRAFECRFPFCSTMRRSRDRRGVFKHPPAGGGKSRGPSGRGLRHFFLAIGNCELIVRLNKLFGWLFSWICMDS